MNALVLPGDIPGLLRRGSPLLLLAGAAGRGLCWDTGTADSVAAADVVDAAHAQGGIRRLAAADVALDLTDATGRAHATWWLARRYTVTRSPYDCVFTRVNGGWVLRCGYSDLAVWTYEVLGVDPEDRRSLPDGSSWLDAEALRIVARRTP